MSRKKSKKIVGNVYERTARSLMHDALAWLVKTILQILIVGLCYYLGIQSGFSVLVVFFSK